MTSAQHRAWLNAGKPVSGLIRPLARLRDRLRGYGYTVYDMGNQQHLDHQPPEDHTPYAATGWPSPSPKWWLHAIDIMPPPAGSGLPTLQQLGAQMLADAKAGHPGMRWLKYMNWEPQGNNTGPCYQESFKGPYHRGTSTDRGHIHQSGRTDMTDYAGADDYDPVARIRGTNPPTPQPQGDDMLLRSPNGSVILAAGGVRVPVKDLAELNAISPAAVTNIPQALMDRFLAAQSGPAPAFTDAQITAIADRLVASNTNGLTPADHAGIVADLKQAQREGTGA